LEWIIKRLKSQTSAGSFFYVTLFSILYYGSQTLQMNNGDDEHMGYSFYCTGCKCHHGVWTDIPNDNGAQWTFNGSMVEPTFMPSLHVKIVFSIDKPDIVCHSFVKDGKIQYLSDCTHSLAGQTVELENLDD